MDAHTEREIYKFYITFTVKQCDQIGRFFNVLGDIIGNRSSPHVW